MTPDEIRCQWKFEKSGWCEREYDYLIRLAPLPCGHDRERGDTQRYCNVHTLNKIVDPIASWATCKVCGITHRFHEVVLGIERI